MQANRLFRSQLALVITASVFFCLAAQAQDTPSQNARFATLLPLLAQIQSQDGDSANITQAVADIVSLTANIDDYVAAGKIKATPDLQRSIDSYRNLIAHVLEHDNEDERYAALQRIRDDARLKWNYVDSQAGFSPFVRSLHIRVYIKTVRKGISAPGYSVACFSLADLDFHPDKPSYPFASDTNNASMDMMPGEYQCRLEKGGKFVGAHALPVGAAKNATQESTFDVSNF